MLNDTAGWKRENLFSEFDSQSMSQMVSDPPENTPPELTLPEDQSMSLGEDIQLFASDDFSIYDADETPTKPPQQFMAIVTFDKDMGTLTNLGAGALAEPGRYFIGLTSFQELFASLKGLKFVPTQAGTVTFTVTVSDGFEGSLASDTMNITVATENHGPTSVGIDGLSSWKESRSGGFTVGILSAVDEEPIGGPFTYRLAEDSDIFEIVKVESRYELRVKQNARFDFETHSQVEAKIIATDREGADSQVHTLTFDITDANDAPVLTAPASTARISFTSTATPFKDVQISDQDEGDQLIVSVELDDPAQGTLTDPSGNVKGSYDPKSGTFTITGTAAEVLPVVQNLVFKPRAPADGVLMETTAFTIYISDGLEEARSTDQIKVQAFAGDLPPTGLALSNTTVDEHAKAGASVGTLSATDPNGDTLTYKLLDDAGGRFQLVGNQVQVKDGVRLDYEQATSHAIRVQVSDKVDTVEKTFTIALNDVLQEDAQGSTLGDVLVGGSGDDVFRGLGGADSLDGGAGRDTLWGGAGNDRLWGRSGKDIFVFDQKPHKTTNLDVIADFKVKDDSVHLDDKAFKGLGKGSAKGTKLKSDLFTLGKKAADKEDRIVYDKGTGALYYDADGTGSKAQVKIATLSKNLKMSAADFFVI